MMFRATPTLELTVPEFHALNACVYRDVLRRLEIGLLPTPEMCLVTGKMAEHSRRLVGMAHDPLELAVATHMRTLGES